MEMETALRDLEIPTDLCEFMTHLGTSNLDWEAVSEGLNRINKTFLALVKKVGMQTEESIDEQIDILLLLPIEAGLPQTFSDPIDPQFSLVVNPLKELTRTITGLCLLDWPKSLKIKMIRCQVHLYSIAASIPLGIGALYAVAILRMSLDNILRLVNATNFTEEEFRELMDAIAFGPISFERMIVGEIGFSFFRTREANGKRVNTYLKKLCRCLTEFRANSATFQIHDLRRIMYGKDRKAIPFNLNFGRAGKIIFELTFEVADIPELLTKWLRTTMMMAADLKQPDFSSDGSWGSMQISRQDGRVHSRISISSFLGKPVEYQIVTFHVIP